ncbi:MAG: MiaB/RimO family radical SAM methylthiotransferase [Alphaproteobacteria bacterium]|nr:MiaB/RimO family radical SAM methylthiotransferase [Alphaproteobacteria bacterium]
MQKKNIRTLSFGCRLNALECEKISRMLAGVVDSAILINTCSVTAEAERQCAQTLRRLSRENPDAIIFVTGCGATRNRALFESVPHALVIDNAEKMNLSAYVNALKSADFDLSCSKIEKFKDNEDKLSKKFIQVQNGCNHDCTYCVTRLLRGKNVSFPYEEILADARAAIQNGFYEIVLTGVDTASYLIQRDGKPFLLADLCQSLLMDVPEIKHLRLSSVDPASPEVPKIIALMNQNSRFMPHLHLSMQSGSDTILRAMRRRHDSKKLMDLVKFANGTVSFSADIICGFPGETEDLFQETLQMVRDMNLVHVHAFPYSPRPNTVAATMPNQVPRNISKQRVQQIIEIANQNREKFMQKQIGKTVSVLVEQNNIGRTPDDIDIKIVGTPIKEKTICDVTITGTESDIFIGNLGRL